MPRIVNAIQNERSIVIQAPFGLGKTIGYLLPVTYFAEGDQRVCILCPTKTHQDQVLTHNYNEMSGVTVQPLLYYGVSNYECPRKGGISSAAYCEAHWETCEKREEGTCQYARDRDAAPNAQIMITNFAKFLSASPRELGVFDIIVIDESHGFEDAVRSYMQARIPRTMVEDSISELASFTEVDFSQAIAVLEQLRRCIDDASIFVGEEDEIPPDVLDEIQTLIMDNQGILDEAEFHIEERMRNPAESSFFSLHKSLIKLLSRLQNRYDNIFLIYEAALLGTPRTERIQQQHVTQRVGDAQVVFVSATIERPDQHAADCGVVGKTVASFTWEEYPPERRRRRCLIALRGGPILKKPATGVPLEERLRANMIIERALVNFQRRSLVLFRSHPDCRAAEAYLRRNPRITPRLHTILDEDIDIAQEKVNRLRENDIVLASASSRLWEGVDIPELKMLIIDALPYVRPPPEIRSRTASLEYNLRKMTRRLQQGIGRLVRSDEDWGIALVVDGRLYRHRQRILPRLPRYIREDLQNSFITTTRLGEVMTDFIQQFEKTYTLEDFM